jgi:hypothetical protein
MILASLPNSPIRRLILNDVGPQIAARGMARISRYAGKDPEFHSFSEAKDYLKRILSEAGPLSDEQWQRITENSVRETAPGKFETKLDHGVKIAPAKSKLAWHTLMHPLKAMEGTLFDIDLWVQC